MWDNLGGYEERKPGVLLGGTMELWITAKVLEPEGLKWELACISDSRDKAVQQCLEPNYCIWPMRLNVPAPQESAVHPDAEYPLWPK